MAISSDGGQVESNISRAWTLPASVYTDPGVHAAEKERIFRCTWQVVGHSGQVANAGDYFTTEIIGEPLLIVRSADGVLRGFYNVCRHRAGPPAEGCGSRKLFRCGYHGWTYDLDGSLISATGMPLKETGQMVKSGSAWLKSIRFVRDYEMRNGISVLKHLQSTVDVRVVGKAELSANYSNPTWQEDEPGAGGPSVP